MRREYQMRWQPTPSLAQPLFPGSRWPAVARGLLPTLLLLGSLTAGCTPGDLGELVESPQPSLPVMSPSDTPSPTEPLTPTQPVTPTLATTETPPPSGPTPTSSPTLTSTPHEPTASIAPTPTETPAPTPSATPTATPTATPLPPPPPTATQPPDLDQDGFSPADGDCDDANPAAYPGGLEVCDGQDNDCNGTIDDEATDALLWYSDLDADGFGDGATPILACQQPASAVAQSGDCDDAAPDVSPEAPEVCDTLDNDCDGQRDEDALDATPFYGDADHDGFGDINQEVMACSATADLSSVAGDCQDADGTIYPNAPEICEDDIDQDCDGADSPCPIGAPGELSINAGSDSTPSTRVTLYLQEPGNVLANPGLQTGDESGWTVTDGGDGWAIQPTGLFPKHHAVVSSYAWCRRAQEINLVAAGYSTVVLDKSPAITVRSWYLGFLTDYTDLYTLHVELRNAQHGVIKAYDFGTTSSPKRASTTWQEALIVPTGYAKGLRYLYFQESGKDVEYWAGNYGTVVDGAAVTVNQSFRMRFSNDGTTWSDWQNFKSTVAWELSPDNGLKQVFVQFEDAYGIRPLEQISDTITLAVP